MAPPPALTNTVSWRTEGIKYRKNEVFLDVVESVNLLINTSGRLLRSEIFGSVQMKVFFKIIIQSPFLLSFFFF